ncbi:lanthionine synthetase LanC family protein [Phenylobacterium sp.]|uniref:lanthionine synthetase LanC family protein n=1 Tax=Phenylobacterium sp. TaxID=1871053 RepID=UPI00289F5509|nr:lanthionine synthetase LanC family protein [Phenylobacterium sp.]
MGRYGQAALEALNFIEAQRAPGTAVWRSNDHPKARPAHTLYHGAGGVILLLLELHAQSGEPALMEKAIAAGDEILAHIETLGELSVNASTGWGGYVFVLGELAKATGLDRYRDGAVACLARVEAAATPLGAGVGWIEPMPFSDITGFTGDREIYDQSVGAAGVILTLLYAQDLYPGALPLAVAAGERLLEVGEATPDGLRWRMMADMPFQFTAPNFAHGGAGVGYALLQLHRATGEARYLDAAKEAARYVMSRSHPVGAGRLVCHNEDTRKPIFYLCACHGPAGTGRLLLELHAVTGEAQWAQALDQLVAGIAGAGAPEERSAGFWNNHGQCCGDAGVGEFALLLARRTGGPAYLDLARRCAEVILGASEAEDGQRRWRQAEHRDRPDFIQAQTGYMQGAAGIASFLQHLDGVLAGEPVKIAMPDWPAMEA